jgi:sporulation protein YlmC with PRC-barrel domain
LAKYLLCENNKGKKENEQGDINGHSYFGRTIPQSDFKKGVKEMNKALAIVAVVFLLSLSFAADSHAGSSMAISGFTEYGSTRLLGSMVTTLYGEELGRILDLELNSQGQVVFALIVQALTPKIWTIPNGLLDCTDFLGSNHIGQKKRLEKIFVLSLILY